MDTLYTKKQIFVGSEKFQKLYSTLDIVYNSLSTMQYYYYRVLKHSVKHWT